MKYIKKILIILFLIIMIYGCKVEYNLKINKDLSVNEKVTASENTDRLKSRTNLDVDQSVKYLYKIYKTSSMKDDGYSIVSADKNTSVVVNNSYNSFGDYISKFHADIFEVYYDNEDPKNTKIDISQYGLIDSKASNRYVYDQIDVTIEVPFEVVRNNADNVSGNKYTWYIKADSGENKHMILVFNSEKFKNSATISLGKKKIHVGYEYIFIILIIIALAAAAVVIYLRNKKNNRM